MFSKAAGCSASPEAINITASIPASQSYKVGEASASVPIIFTSDSIYCTQPTDIVYAMTVTPSPSGMLSNFITFDSTTRIVTWQTNDNTKAGTYSISLTGMISALTPVTAKNSFTLTVATNCFYSTETIILTSIVAIQ